MIIFSLCYNIQYETLENKVITGVSSTTVLEIPITVERIKDSDFRDRQLISQVLYNLHDILEEVIFPQNSNIISLGVATFCNFLKLSRIDLTNCKKLLSIDKCTFALSSLTSIILPSNLQSIGVGAFCYTHLEAVDIPSSVTYIDGYFLDKFYFHGPFESCEKLKSLNIHGDSKITFIGCRFAALSKIETVFIPKETALTPATFNGILTLKTIRIHDQNTNYALYNNCLYSADFSQFFWAPNNYPQKLTFHESLRILPFFSFHFFYYSFDLEIPSSVSEIHDHCFSDCNVSNIIFNTEKPKFIGYPFVRSTSSIQMPRGLTTITGGMFNLYLGTYILFPKYLREIQSSAFHDCHNLQTLKFESNLEKNIIIRSGAFLRLSKLDKVLVDSKLFNKFSIEQNAFINCPLLKEIHYVHNSSVTKKIECIIQTCKQVNYNNMMYMYSYVFILL